MLRWQNQPDDERLTSFRPPQVGEKISPEQACWLALDAALQGFGFVAPNPPVGAVAVDANHCFLGFGAHLKYGEAHAEQALLKKLDDEGLRPRLKHGKMYVSLEPCSFVGKTPACALLLKDTGLAEVVIGANDPNPRVDGKGRALLTAAGITATDFPAAKAAAAELIDVFSWNQKSAKVFVALKAAASLDGTIAYEGGANRRITDERARLYGHFLRLKYDAIMVGAETLRLDNPELTCRYAGIRVRQPRPVILDPFFKTPTAQPLNTLKVFDGEKAGPIWFADSSRRDDEKAKALAARGAHLVFIPSTAGNFDPAAVLAELSALNISSVLLEGGAGLYGSFLNANLVNKLHLFQAPTILGGPGRLGWGDGFTAMTEVTASGARVSPLDRNWVIEVAFKT